MTKKNTNEASVVSLRVTNYSSISPPASKLVRFTCHRTKHGISAHHPGLQQLLRASQGIADTSLAKDAVGKI